MRNIQPLFNDSKKQSEYDDEEPVTNQNIIANTENIDVVKILAFEQDDESLSYEVREKIKMQSFLSQSVVNDD